MRKEKKMRKSSLLLPSQQTTLKDFISHMDNLAGHQNIKQYRKLSPEEIQQLVEDFYIFDDEGTHLSKQVRLEV